MSRFVVAIGAAVVALLLTEAVAYSVLGDGQGVVASMWVLAVVYGFLAVRWAVRS